MFDAVLVIFWAGIVFQIPILYFKWKMLHQKIEIDVIKILDFIVNDLIASLAITCVLKLYDEKAILGSSIFFIFAVTKLISTILKNKVYISKK